MDTFDTDLLRKWRETNSTFDAAQRIADENRRVIDSIGLKIGASTSEALRQFQEEMAGVSLRNAIKAADFLPKHSHVLDSFLVSAEKLNAFNVSPFTDGVSERLRELEDVKSKVLGTLLGTLPDASSRLTELAGASGLLEAMNRRSADFEAALSRLPTISVSAAAQIAGLWGAEGIQRQLDALGIDWPAERDAEEGRTPAEEGKAFERPRYLPTLDFWNVLNLILVIATFLYQLNDSKAMEERIIERSVEHRAAVEKQMQALLAEVLAALQPREEANKTEFVVRSREALIRREARSGATVVAKVYPNQVVTLLGEKQQWINVQYFDWIAQELRVGWALKKYFARVTPPPTR